MCTELSLTSLLFGHECGYAGSVDFRIVESVVLRSQNATVPFGARDRGSRLEGGEDRILGIIFVITGVVCGAMQVGAHAPQNRGVRPDRIISDDLAPLFGKILAEGLPEHGFAGHYTHRVAQVLVVGIDGIRVTGGFVGVGILAERVGGESVRTIILDDLWGGNRFDGLGGRTTECGAD